VLDQLTRIVSCKDIIDRSSTMSSCIRLLKLKKCSLGSNYFTLTFSSMNNNAIKKEIPQQ